MRITAESRVRAYCEQYPDAAAALGAFLTVARAARWRNLQEMRLTYPHADAVEAGSGRTLTVFNIRGNHYRLVTAIHYNTGRLFVLRFLTHAEYDRDAWKESL